MEFLPRRPSFGLVGRREFCDRSVDAVRDGRFRVGLSRKCTDAASACGRFVRTGDISRAGGGVRAAVAPGRVRGRPICHRPLAARLRVRHLRLFCLLLRSGGAVRKIPYVPRDAVRPAGRSDHLGAGDHGRAQNAGEYRPSLFRLLRPVAAECPFRFAGRADIRVRDAQFPALFAAVSADAVSAVPDHL